jgi:hypothetical protein
MGYPKGVIKKEVGEVVEFAPDKLLSVTPSTGGTGSCADIAGESFHISIRSAGEFAGKGFYLSDDYNWFIVKDSSGYLVLVPTKKV